MINLSRKRDDALTASCSKQVEVETDELEIVMSERLHLFGRSTFEVSYVASVDVGKNGSSKIVQEGIRKALEEKENESNKIEKEVVIALMERDIVVTDRLTEESLGLYSYTKTSSCGLGEEKHGLFGFITGNTSCSFANKFVCHVFRAPNHDTAQDIITGIGRGFNRTLYCV